MTVAVSGEKYTDPGEASEWRYVTIINVPAAVPVLTVVPKNALLCRKTAAERFTQLLIQKNVSAVVYVKEFVL